MDDGVLVASQGHAEEAIVWVGDLELLVDGARSLPQDAVIGASRRVEPHIQVHATGRGVDLEWPITAETFRLRLTLPCRPSRTVTFENDSLNPAVVLGRRGPVSIATFQPYAELASIEISFVGVVEFQADPAWRRGLPVSDADGGQHFEDRFSPGEFTVRPPRGAGSLRVAVRLVDHRGRGIDTAGDPADAGERRSGEHGRHSVHGATRLRTSRERRFDAIALPGKFASSAIDDSALADMLECDLRVDSGDVQAGVLAHDASLWWVRAARLALAARPATSPSMRAMRHDLIRPRLAALALDLVDLAGARPMEHVLEGASRWWTDAGAVRDGEHAGPIAIESAALLHGAMAWLSELSGEAGDTATERQARVLAARLQRWFRSAFWLTRPDRPADVAFTSGTGAVSDRPPSARDRVAALALRPGMLLAASFEDAPFDARQRRVIVRAAEARLLTEFGIRTLDVDDADFDASSRGNGAAWPWLLGPFVEASLRGFGPERGRHLALEVLLEDLESAPEAWVCGQDRCVPLGSLRFEVNGAEACRARELLRTGAPEFDGLGLHRTHGGRE